MSFLQGFNQNYLNLPEFSYTPVSDVVCTDGKIVKGGVHLKYFEKTKKFLISCTVGT